MGRGERANLHGGTDPQRPRHAGSAWLRTQSTQLLPLYKMADAAVVLLGRAKVIRRSRYLGARVCYGDNCVGRGSDHDNASNFSRETHLTAWQHEQYNQPETNHVLNDGCAPSVAADGKYLFGDFHRRTAAALHCFSAKVRFLEELLQHSRHGGHNANVVDIRVRQRSSALLRE